MDERKRPILASTSEAAERHGGDPRAGLDRLLLERELHLVVCRYARACDERDWDAIEKDVFSADASADYGGRHLRDRAAIRAMLVAHLGGCGPTQHLLGNLVVDVGDANGAVTSKAYIRAAHRGADELRDQTYECMGEYADRWVRTDRGEWRIAHRRMTVGFEFGSRGVLRAKGG